MRKILFVIFLFVSSLNLVLAQSQYWLLKGGGTGMDEGLDISMDAAGNTYTTGYFSGAAQFGTNITLGSHGVTDIFVAKVDALGNYVWVQRAGGMGPDKGLSIKTDAAGNSYITGFFQGTATFGGISITSVGYSQDVFLAKYNTMGVLQWVKSAGGTHGDLGNAVTLDNFGHVYVTGQFSGIASFGSFSLISMMDPSSGSYSFDVFTAKFNAATGDVIWVRQGTAVHTDRGMDLGCDAMGNIYVTGQFSDTITFGATHNNNMYNAIFLIKYDSTGAEQWFRMMGGSIQCITYGLTVDGNNNVYITGDFMDKLVFFGPPNITITNPYPNSIFIAKYGSGGNYLWAKSDGSLSDVTARNIVVDGASNAYVTGSFRCRMNQWADIYGQGTFNSICFEDVFALKYDASGIRQWARQSGGKKNDRGNGIVVNGSHDITVCGGFNDKIFFPGSSHFIWTNPNYFIMDSLHVNYCSDNAYYLRFYLKAAGVSDIFICKGFDPDKQPYDYYIHHNSPNCWKPYIGVDIVNSQQVAGEIPDSMVECGMAVLAVDSNADLRSGPHFNYLWSDGVTNDTTYAYNSGLYTITQSTDDGCFVSTDSIYVTIHPLPAEPTITDSKGINVNTINPDTLFICLPDSVILTAGNICSTCTGNWTGTGIHIDSVTIRPTHSDWFIYTVINNFNCINKDSILVIIDTMVQQPIFTSGLYGPDTITICQGDSIRIIIRDTLVYDPNPPGTPYWHGTLWSLHPMCPNVDSVHFMYFYPAFSGIYKVWDVHFIIVSNACCSYVQILRDTITIVVTFLPNPPIDVSLVGNFTICPGDTSIISAVTNATSYQWLGPGFLGPINQDTMSTDIAGDYTLITGFVSPGGCITHRIDLFTIDYTHAPVVSMDPWTGLICPDTTITLTCNATGIYSWFGPQGPIDTNQQSIMVSTPGMYYCVLTDATGCVIVSNTVEVMQYNTPYIIASPSTVICPGEPITIAAITNVGSVVDWHPPLSGHDSIQIITEPGVYTASITSCGIITEVEIVITATSLTNIISTSGPVDFCSGSSVTLTACSGGAMYQWSNDSIGNSISVNQSGTYTVTVMDIDGCSESAIPITVNVTQIDPPVAHDTTVCYGSTITLHATSADTIKWFSMAEGGVPINTGSNFTTPPVTDDTTYFVQSEDTTCTSIRVPLHITVYPGSSPPILTANSPICTGDTLSIEVDTIMTGNYSWTGPGGFQATTPEIQINNATIANSGTYNLVLSSADCPSQLASIQVEVDSINAPFITSDLLGSDSVNVCIGEFFTLTIHDSIYNNTFLESSYVHTTVWSSVPTMVINGNAHTAACHPTQSGIYTIYENHTIILNQSCNNDTVVLHDSISVYVNFTTIYAITLALDGNMQLCPNGTLIINAITNGEQCLWSGPGLVGPDNLDSVVINTPGTYQIIASQSDSAGCNGQDTANFIVISTSPPLLSMNPSNGMICPGDSVALSVNVGGGSYNWFGPDGAISINQQSILADAPGSYYCVVTDSNGCALASGNVMLFEYITPYLTANPNAVLCPNDSIALHVTTNADSTLQWQPPLSGSEFFQNVTTPGIYTCNVTSCGIITPASITITASALTPIITASGPLSICLGDSVILYGCSGGTSYLWSNNSTASSLVVYQPGTYSVTVTDSNGCVVSATPDTVTQYQLPPPTVHDTTVCYGTSLTLHATAPGAVQWYISLYGGTPFFIGNDYTVEPVTDDFTLYCQTNDTASISIRIPVHIYVYLGSFPHTITGISPICEEQTLMININAVTPGSYSWTGPDGFHSTSPNVIIYNSTIDNSGTYILRDSTSGCATQILSIDIQVHAKPHATFDYQFEPVCDGVQGNFTNSSLPTTNVAWYLSNIFASSNMDFSYIFPYNDSINIALIAYNNACTDTLQLNIPLIYPDAYLLPPPNVFTPNNDSYNDCFQLKTYPSFQDCYKMEIYNRWGKRIFVKNTNDKCWDGINQNDGKYCAQGVYYYIITIGAKSYHGSVTLLR